MLTVRVGTSPLRSARRVPPRRLVLLSGRGRHSRRRTTNSLDPADLTTNLSGAARLLRDRNLTPAGCGARGRSTALPLALCNPTARGLLQNRRYAWRDRQFCWDAKPIRRSALAGRSSERSAGRSRCIASNWYRACTRRREQQGGILQRRWRRRKENERRMPKAKDVIGYAHDKKAVMVDLKFMDFLGLWQHFTIPLAELTEAGFDEGLGLDSSSIRGRIAIHNNHQPVPPHPYDR